MKIKNAKIDDFSIFYEDHGILTSFVSLDYGNAGQGFGGFSLGGKGKVKGHIALGIWVENILDVVGVDSTKDLAGEAVRVKVEDDHGWGSGSIIAIGHFTEDKWFNPKEEFKKLKD